MQTFRITDYTQALHTVGKTKKNRNICKYHSKIYDKSTAVWELLLLEPLLISGVRITLFRLVTNLKAKQLISHLSVTSSGKRFYFQNLQAGFGIVPSSYLMGAEQHACAAEGANSCVTNNFIIVLLKKYFREIKSVSMWRSTDVAYLGRGRQLKYMHDFDDES
jgi:hypothetical protein